MTNPKDDKAGLTELEIIWKRVHRLGRYYDKPIKWTEFKNSIEAYTEKRVVEARIDELKKVVTTSDKFSTDEYIANRLNELEVLV